MLFLALTSHHSPTGVIIPFLLTRKLRLRGEEPKVGWPGGSRTSQHDSSKADSWWGVKALLLGLGNLKTLKVTHQLPVASVA